MPESLEHMNLVKRLEYVAHDIVPEPHHIFICSDTPDSNVKPERTSDNYAPDLMFKNANIMIIGEAKTGSDVDRQHSINQYESYMKDLNNFPGRKCIIFAVPWYSKNTIKNISKRLRAKFCPELDIFVITEIGEAEQL